VIVLFFQLSDNSPIIAKHIELETHKDIADKVGPTRLIHDLNYDPTLKRNWNCLLSKDVCYGDHMLLYRGTTINHNVQQNCDVKKKAKYVLK